MKKFLVLAILMTLTSVAFAQVPTPATNPRIIDSTGIATKHWQEVDFITSAVRNVTYLNKSTTKTLRIALRGEDTVSTQTRYQTLLAPGRTATLGTTQRYAYIRTDDTAGTPTAAYSISNVLTMSLGGGSDSSTVILGGVSTKIDTTNAALGRIEGLLPAGIGTASDTLNGPYNNTTYAVGDIKQDSTAKWMVFNIAANAGILINASATADTANATANVRRLLLVADTTGWGVLTADNAQFALTAAKAGKVVGEIVFAMKTEGTGSTAAYRSVEVRRWFRTVIGQKLFGLVVMDGAYTGKKREQSTFTLTFIKQN